MKWLLLVFAVISALLAVGCGGSGRNVPIANPRVDVTWPAQRSITAPTSALSVRVTVSQLVSGALETVHQQVFDRPSEPVLNISTYTLSKAIPVGSYTFDFEFFSQAGASGSVVGKSAVTTELAVGGGVAIDLTVPTKVQTVTVPAGQTVRMSTPQALLFEVRNAEGAVLVIDPKVVQWASADATKLKFEDGIAMVVAPSAAVAVTATVDGVVSASQDVAAEDDLARARFVAAPAGFHGVSMSGDGNYVGGYVDVPGTGRMLARWTVGTAEATVVQPLSVNAGAIEVSAAGTFAIGGRPTSLWSVPGGVQIELGYPQATQTSAQSIDDDGNTVVGTFEGTLASGAFRWKSNAGMQRIFGDGEAAALGFAHVRTSRDGNTVAGIVSGDQNRLAVDRSGNVTIYDTGALNYYFAIGNGADAPVVVTKQGPMSAMVITSAGMTTLTVPDGFAETIAHAVSADGSVIVGEAYTESAMSKSYLWIDRVPVSLSAYAQSLGLELNQFNRFYLVSNDGKSLYGTNGDFEGVVRFTTP